MAKKRLTDSGAACPFPPGLSPPGKELLASVDQVPLFLKPRMNIRLVSTILIAGLTITAISYFILLNNSPLTYTGRITAVNYPRDNTLITFANGDTLEFDGQLMFEVGGTYTFNYHRYGLLWQFMGYNPELALDSAIPIDPMSETK